MISRLQWQDLPEDLRKQLIQSLKTAETEAMSSSAPGAFVDLEALHQAAKRLLVKVEKYLNAAENHLLQTAENLGIPDENLPVWLSFKMRQLDEKAMEGGKLLEEIGTLAIKDPMGPSRMLPKLPRVYLGFRPEHIQRFGMTKFEDQGYIFFADQRELVLLSTKKVSPNWRTTIVQVAAHELTHYIQALFNPKILDEYIEPSKKYKEYRKQPVEREAQLASIEALLRFYGPGIELKRALETFLDPKEIYMFSKDIARLQDQYRNRILNMAGSFVTAEAIAKRLGLTERAMNAFMKTIRPSEGWLETIEQKAIEDETTMIKLASLWKMAEDIDDETISLEEAEKWLKQFERQELQTEEAKVPSPSFVTTVSQPPPVKITPDPEIYKHRKHETKEWNVLIELHPPATDGTWLKVSETVPLGFPFPSESLNDGQSIRALFRKPETWMAIKEMASNPSKRELIQSYLLPKIVLAIGKAWWEINKHQKQLGNAPFGLLTQEEFLEYKNKGVAPEETIAGRAFITFINWRVTKLFQYYLAVGKPDGKLDGYIYESLNRRMVAEAGKRQGFEPKQKPVCTYCKWKRNIETTPPILTETRTFYVQEEGKRRKRPIYKCQTCAQLVENEEKELQLKEQNIFNNNRDLNNINEDIKNIKKNLEQNPDSKELKLRLQSQLANREELNSKLSALIEEQNKLKKELYNRNLMLDVPYSHLACINENCPGHAIPLTFVDWQDPFWKTPDGEKARRKMANLYGITETPEGQKAEDGTGETAIEKEQKKPPEWMWDVPFRCPFDGIHFTPRAAFGKGKQKNGGLFIDPPRTVIWWKPYSTTPSEKDESEETDSRRLEEIKDQTGIKTTTDSNAYLTDQEEKMYYQSLANSLRQEFYHTKEEHAMRTGGITSKKRTTQLQALLYDAVLEWSYIHPLHLVGYFTRRMPVKRKIVDKDTGEVRPHLEFRKLSTGGAEQTVSSLIQTWFSKVLEQKNGWELLKPYLTSESAGQDKVPPRAYFIATVQRQGETGALEAKCGLRYGKNSPLGKESPRGSSYDKNLYLALVEGIWEIDGSPNEVDLMTPISPEKGALLTHGKTSCLADMDVHDSHKIIFDSSTSLKEGSTILVKALFMPRHTAWIPIRRIMFLRKSFEDMNEDMADLMNALGRIADENEEDVKLIAKWREGLRDMGLPGQLKEFDKALQERLEKNNDK